MAFLIDLENDAKSVTLTTVWPLEILALKASIKTYSLKRKPWSRERLVSALSIKGENLSIILKIKFSNGIGTINVFIKHIKGQLISKCPFGIKTTSKKSTEFFPGFLP